MALNASFQGKKVLVTGGANGIGKTIVERLVKDNAIVFVLDKNAEAIQKLKKELPQVRAENVDLTKWKETKAVIETFGVLDCLVNNAALVIQQNFMDITEEAAALQFNVNVLAAINVSQAVAKGMIEAKSGGSIVNISSVAADRYVSKFICYCSTKAAITMLTKTMAVDLGAHGIRVNCVQPGPVDSPLAKDEQGNLIDEASRMMNLQVIKKLADPNDIADLVLFLLSPRSAMITGEAVNINGGYQITNKDWNATKSIIASFGVLDHLVNNAGVYKGQSFMEVTEEDAKFQFDVNVGAIFNVSQAVAKAMIEKKSGGSIINISSAAAKKHIPGLAVYGATKAAVTMLTKSMAVDLGEHRIRVNCIQPGLVDTPLIRLPDGRIWGSAEQTLEQTVMKRLIDPNEIADLVMFLLSPLSSMITGEAVNIDGCYL